MKTWVKVLIVVAAVVALITIPFVTTYNSIVGLENKVDAQWGEVENKLQRRYDLIPNLVNSVQGSMNQEKEVFTAIADARAKLAGASTTDEKVEANNELDSAVSRLLVVVENYPELKSNEAVVALMDELAGTENRISTERGRYNEAVEAYNTKIKKFPAVIFASLMGKEQKPYFKAVEGAEVAPTVDFDK